MRNEYKKQALLCSWRLPDVTLDLVAFIPSSFENNVYFNRAELFSHEFTAHISHTTDYSDAVLRMRYINYVN